MKKQSNSKRSMYKGGRSNGKQNNRRNRDTGAEFEGTDDFKSKSNDPGWYSTDPALLRDAASIPFSWAVGTPIDMAYDGDEFFDYANHNVNAIPGIMTLTCTPTFGLSLGKTSPLNIASNAMYAYVRHANSGHSNYDAPDLMVYCLSFTQVFSLINWMQRLYGCATLYSQRNRYLPEALIEAQGVNFDDINSNLANYRYGLNLAISKAASFAVPSTMSLFKRSAFMYQNVYSGGESVKDQIYMFNPRGFMFYTEDETGAHLEYRSVESYKKGAKLTAMELLSMLNDMLAPLIGSEDINIMSGDILKAYGQEGILKLASIGESYPLVPIHDTVVLEQIKNATIMPTISTVGVHQSDDKSHLISKVMLPFVDSCTGKAYRAVYNANRILTTTHYDSTPELVMENTRLMAIGQRDESNTTRDYVVCGTEVVSAASIYYYGFDDSREWVLKSVNLTSAGAIEFNQDTGVTNLGQLKTYLKRASMLSHFKYAPFMTTTLFEIPNSEIERADSIEVYNNFDVDNYAIINVHTLSKLHETALMNMIAVPSIAKFAKLNPNGNK